LLINTNFCYVFCFFFLFFILLYISNFMCITRHTPIPCFKKCHTIPTPIHLPTYLGNLVINTWNEPSIHIIHLLSLFEKLLSEISIIVHKLHTCLLYLSLTTLLISPFAGKWRWAFKEYLKVGRCLIEMLIN